MTRISVASLRVSNPHIKVILVCDALTGDLLQTTEDPLTSEVDTTIVVETPSGNSGFRNRFVKTQLPSIMPGKFLFLDGDTFVRDSLDSVFQLECDIAGARNHSQERLEDQIWSQDSEVLETMCWQVSDEVYINGGVLFVNDSEGARRVFKAWFDLWSEVAEGEGYHRDQPALNTAIFRTKPNLVVLDDKYNAQFVANESVSENASIWHYYSSAEPTKMTVFNSLLSEALGKEKVSRRKIRAIVNRPLPWAQIAIVSKADAAGGGASRVAQDLAEILNKSSKFSAHHWLGYAGNDWKEHYRGLHGGPKLRFLQRSVSWFSLKAGFPDFFTPEIFIHYLKKADDYILYHFHDISRTFSPVAMRWLAKRKPVVWTLHDCCSFTGGCLYPMNCEAFTKGCGNCPQLDVWPLKTPFDRTHWMHAYKKKTALAGLITPIAPSNWIADEAFRSGMFESRPEVIPYSVDSQTFQPLIRNQIRQELSLPVDRFIALLNVHNIADPRKGVRDAIAATKQLEVKPLLAALGTVDAAAQREFEGLDVRFLGYVADRTQLSKYCAAADILLFPTFADNLPNAVLEALACGTPTVGYATGGMPDMVEHKVNGWLAETGDIHGLAQGIEFCRTNPDTLIAWSKRSREFAITKFSEERFIEAHVRIYESLLEQHSKAQADKTVG